MTISSLGGALFALAPRLAAEAVVGSGDPALDTAVLVLFGAVGLVVAFGVTLLILRRVLFICRPNEILVFSGRSHRLQDGTTSGYKILHGGRALRMPFLESISRMDMRLFPVEVSVHNAYSRGGIPLSVHAIANVKISSNDVGVRNAVERFLGATQASIATAAQQTLEGVLREVVSQLTPEEVNEDRLKFAHTLVENARDDLDKLGLELDVLKVQHVADDQQYLVNLGRGQIATILRDAANAENQANQAVAEAHATQRQRAETAQKRAETVIVQAKNGYRGEIAKLEAEAKQVENEAAVAAETERAIAEQELQSLRSEMEKLRLHCDVILPAEAERRFDEEQARGEAATIIETGRAEAEALNLLVAEFRRAGSNAREVLALQQMMPLLSEISGARRATKIATLSVLPGGESSDGGLARKAISVVAQIRAATGVDLTQLASRLGAQPADAAALPVGSGSQHALDTRPPPLPTRPRQS